MDFEYIKRTYNVPAEIGRIVTVSGKRGIIVVDRGHYLGVNFDCDKAGVVKNAHPTSEVEYFGMGKIRTPLKSKQRYTRFLEYGDGFQSFLDYCRWDSCKDRSWNH
tara:strand:+ start:563 stop:880 length:318 start_codon:yes stop_codon:yes gene_type:complete